MQKISTSPTPRTERLCRLLGAAQLVFAAALLAVSFLLFFNLRDLYSRSDAEELAQTLESYAQAVEIQKENYASVYGNIPSYHQLFLDSVENVESLENIAKVLASVAEYRFFKGLRNSAAKLEKLALQLKDSFSKTAETLAAYTPEKHEKTLQAFDKTIEELNKTAEKFRRQKNIAFSLPYLILAFGILFSAGMFMNGWCFLLSASPEKAER